MWEELDLIDHRIFGIGIILKVTRSRIRVFFIDKVFEAVLDLPTCFEYGLLEKNSTYATKKRIRNY